jgi:hypothetical protein
VAGGIPSLYFALPRMGWFGAGGSAERYDGDKPAEGTTETAARAHPVDAVVRNDAAHRDPALYANVINQFAVEVNPRYVPINNGKTDFCNIFLWDLTRAMGVEIPHWVDPKTGLPADRNVAMELSANQTVDWMNVHGPACGWRIVTAAQAQQQANLGHPAIALWKNPTGRAGHAMVIRPGVATDKGDCIAQAGRVNANHGHVYDNKFPAASPDVVYWAHD